MVKYDLQQNWNWQSTSDKENKRWRLLENLKKIELHRTGKPKNWIILDWVTFPPVKLDLYRSQKCYIEVRTRLVPSTKTRFTQKKKIRSQNFKKLKPLRNINKNIQNWRERAGKDSTNKMRISAKKSIESHKKPESTKLSVGKFSKAPCHRASLSFSLDRENRKVEEQNSISSSWKKPKKKKVIII